VVLVLLVLAAATASYRFELGPRWFGFESPDPAAAPASVAPPEGLELPVLEAPSPVADPATDSALDPRKVRRALAGALGDPDLGRHVLAAVTSPADGTPVVSRGAGVAVPASTMKLLTTTAALSALGPDHTFSTDVVSGGHGRVVLVGGGDPLLASRPAPATTYPHRADVVTLARATATALREQGVRRVRVGYDDSLFTGPAVNPRWPDDYVPDGVVAPITALWVDEGRPPSGLGRVADPSRAAADAFAAALRRAGVDVVGAPTPRKATSGATELASIESAPLAGIVEETLGLSDNEAAEVLAHHVGLATTGRGSFAGGAKGVVGVLSELGLPLAGARVYDGSGLSRDDRLDPRTLAAVLQAAASDELPELRPVVTGLPVAGFSGSLELRFAEAGREGLGRVRAKTGTLSGVSALAGIATDRDGHPMVFVLMADRVALEDTLAARDALDELAAALASCRCG
jgi:D-alanyl-D-alanine carboxypeptidase/D-alanyl-D-alanine-endopeptidase (penicillin-binding protein 4)